MADTCEKCGEDYTCRLCACMREHRDNEFRERLARNMEEQADVLAQLAAKGAPIPMPDQPGVGYRWEGLWRVGRKVGRTIYEGDKLIGMMDTPELASRVVAAVNLAVYLGLKPPNA